jgi:hypothetical protein
VTHARNLGALATFNLAFRPSHEPFYTLLEDDNWWEPRFLEVLLAAMAAHPSVTVAWCNQKVWQEEADGTWRDTGRLVNSPEKGPGRLVSWGNPRQALGAQSANGAMLVRSRPGASYSLTGVPFSGMEATRERQFPHPLLYVPEPLAVYSITQASARAGDSAAWFACQVALLATFARHAQLNNAACESLWEHYRRHRPPPTNVFIGAALVSGDCRYLLRQARLVDWLRFLKSAVGHPVSVWRALRVRQHFPDMWNLLDRSTAARFAESPDNR